MKTLGRSISGLTVLSDAGEGNKFFKWDRPSVNGRFLVVFHPRNKLENETSQHFDCEMTARQFFRFMSKQELFDAAKEAGLNDEWSEKVANGEVSLDEALGDMDMDLECDEMDEDRWAGQGGEDDGTPPLEVLMAGGWAAWEHENEKNAWLDSRF